ncbi:MAG: leucine-rich repeat domain-containing protein, partial [Bacteroidales bacterium]|nr:leucine-rich repeat domain-containing protein [Candidatus Colicola coprequi]
VMIEDNAFSNCSSLTSVTISKSVTTIGSSAFEGCSSLTSIIIPDSVTKIGNSAFQGCSGLTSVTIGNSVTDIGEYAFARCSGLIRTNYTGTIADWCKIKFETSYYSSNNYSNPMVYSHNFYINDVEVKDLVIPDDVDTIRNYAFYGCSGLTSATIPNSVTTIEGSAFEGCSGMTSVTIPNSVTTIGGSAFYGCSGLTSVIIPSSVTMIGGSVFYGCSGLTSVVIPNSVTTIGKSAFYNCSGLTSITIPNSVTTIGDRAFSGCGGLTSVTIGNAVTTIGEWAFLDCDSLQSVTWNAIHCNDFAYNSTPFCYKESDYDIYGSAPQITELVFGDSVQYIPVYLCTGMKNLNAISVHAVTPPTCGYNCFANVSRSIPVYVPARSVDAYKKANEWRNFTNIQGFPEEYAMIICYAFNGTIKGGGKLIKGDTCTLVVTPDYGYHFTQWSDGNTDNPRSFVITQDSAFTAVFARNIYTFDVQTADSVMGSVTGTKGSYEYETNLTISATSNYGYHFAQWSDGSKDNPHTISLTRNTVLTAYFAKNTYSITIPSMENGSVQGAKYYRYLDTCTLVVTPDWGYHFTQWNDGNTDNPRSFVVTQDTTFTAQIDTLIAGQCGDYLYWEIAGDTLIITGSGEMYDYTISHPAEWYLSNDKITKLIMDDGITRIGDYAFYSLSNKNLKEIALPNSVETIGKYAFAECSYLKTITLGAKLEDIDEYAFQNDERLIYVNCYAEEPPVLQENAFDNYDIYLQVPCEVVDEYKVAKGWKLFNKENVSCLSAEGKTVTGDDVIVTPSATEATFVWPSNDQADSYSLEITKDGVVFCTLKFNANGQLTGIAFAPSRGEAHTMPAATMTTNGWQFTVTGLNQASKYAYTMDVTDASQKSIKTYTGEFATDGYTDLEGLTIDNAQCTVQKMIIDNQLFIRRGNELYNAIGQKVR